MLTLPPSVRIYVSTESVDMRRGHDGLAAIVRSSGWDVNLFDGHLFVFLGRRFDRVKILFWDRGGFVLYYKRLERGRFRLPRVTADAKVMNLGAGELAMLLDGIDIQAVKQPKRWLPGSQCSKAA